MKMQPGRCMGYAINWPPAGVTANPAWRRRGLFRADGDVIGHKALFILMPEDYSSSNGAKPP
ncbi:hypothetical protein SAMN05216563_102375 [Phytobacter palmae]|nr:hypothetical protein SAMN05216563_102375 [Phytobacter palmae]